MAAGFAPPPQTAAGFGARFGGPPRPPKPPVPPRAGYVPGQGYQTPGGWNAAQPQQAGFAPHPGYNPGSGYQTPGGWNAPQTPTAPTAQATAPGNSATTQTPPGPPPLDAQALQAIAQHQFAVNNQITGLNTRSGYADTNLQTRLDQLQHRQPLDELAASQGANRRGALFSTVLGKQLGNLRYNFQQNQGSAQTSHDRLVAGIAAQIKGLLEGVPLFNEGQALGSTLRASKGLPPAPPTATPPPPAPNSPAGKLAAAIAQGSKFNTNPSSWGRTPPGFKNAQVTVNRVNAPKPFNTNPHAWGRR